MFIVNFDSTEQAEFIAEIINPFGVSRPRVDGSILRLCAEALEILAEIDETQDGHYDGTHIWISGTEYHVTRKIGRPSLTAGGDSTRIALTIDPAIITQIDTRANRDGISRSEAIRQAINTWLA